MCLSVLTFRKMGWGGVGWSGRHSAGNAKPQSRYGFPSTVLHLLRSSYRSRPGRSDLCFGHNTQVFGVLRGKLLTRRAKNARSEPEARHSPRFGPRLRLASGLLQSPSSGRGRSGLRPDAPGGPTRARSALQPLHAGQLWAAGAGRGSCPPTAAVPREAGRPPARRGPA